MGRAFGTAMSGRSKGRQELADLPIPLTANLTVVACRAGEGLIRELFEPLGYSVVAQQHPLDEKFPEWGEGPYYSVTLAGTFRLQDLLNHLYVLVPVLDAEKHYWIGQDEVEKLLRKGEGWLGSHPHKETIVKRYLPLEWPAAGGTTAKLPVVFDFVGGERVIFYAEGHGFAHYGATKGYITVCPANPVANQSTALTPGGQVVRILDALEAAGYPIDRSRVYVVGMSAGGVATATTGLEIPSVVAAVAMHSSIAVMNTEPDATGTVPFSTPAGDYTKAMDYQMPLLAEAGDHDMAMLPISTEGVINGLNLWLQVNGCSTQLDPAATLAAAATSTDAAVKAIGVTGDKMWTETIDGVVNYGAEFNRADGVKMVELICVANLPHQVSGSFPEIAWDFMSRFSRDVDGNLVVAK